MATPPAADDLPGVAPANAARLGALAGTWMAHWWSIKWVEQALIAASVVLLVAFWWVWIRMRYSANSLEKGVDAEERTGEVSLSRRPCYQGLVVHPRFD